MKNYELVSFNNDNRKFVMSTSYISPLSNIFLISDELAKENYKGEVIFDLLLSNGFASNRFLSMYFDGNDLLPQSTKTIKVLSKDLLVSIYKYYYVHSDYVKNSSLPDVQKELIKENKIARNLISS